jgi:drug/metabolite transporter (DMT)-like permease
MSRNKWLPVAGLLLAMLLWGSSFIVLKVAFKVYDPMVVIFGRMAVASLLFPLVFFRFREIVYRRGDWKYLLLMAFFEPCLYFTFEAKALENTTASQAGMITAMLPLMVAVAAHLLLKEKVTRKTLFGFGVAIVGVAWLSLSGDAGPDAPNPLLGNFFEFLAMVSATGYTILLRKLSVRYNPFFLAGLQAIVGSFFFLPFLFLKSTTMPMHIDPVGVFSIFYLGIVITLGAYGLYNYGLSRLPAGQASSYVNLIPVFTILLGWSILGETFTVTQYLAAALVFAGVILSQDSREQTVVPVERPCAVSISN